MSKKRQRRINATAEEFEGIIAKSVHEAAIVSKDDESLFTVDRDGSKSQRMKIAKTVASNGTVSQTEKKLVQRAKKSMEKKVNSNEAQPREVHDIWGDVSTKKQIIISSKPTINKRFIAKPGQSYNPSFEDHQDVLAEALALEMKKREDDSRKHGQMDLTISELTKSVTIPDDMESDEEDEAGAGGDVVKWSKSRRARERLTRAQRNKIRTKHITSHQEGKIKQDKKILKEITSLPVLLKEMQQDDQLLAAKKELRDTVKNAPVDCTALSYEEAGAVPLSDELKGSLRALLPRGCALKTKAQDMVTQGHAMSQHRRKPKLHDKPHAEQNIKWIAKYKLI